MTRLEGQQHAAGHHVGERDRELGVDGEDQLCGAHLPALIDDLGQLGITDDKFNDLDGTTSVHVDQPVDHGFG